MMALLKKIKYKQNEQFSNKSFLGKSKNIYEILTVHPFHMNFFPPLSYTNLKVYYIF